VPRPQVDGPEIMLGADFGLSAMTRPARLPEQGRGRATEAVPRGGPRRSRDPSLARGRGPVRRMYNSIQASMSPAASVGFVTTGGKRFLRLTAPLPFVRPYVFGGVGTTTSLWPARRTRRQDRCSTRAPAGPPHRFRPRRPAHWYLSLDAEATYHYLIGESFSAVTTNGIDGGDVSTVNAVLRVRM